VIKNQNNVELIINHLPGEVTAGRKGAAILRRVSNHWRKTLMFGNGRRKSFDSGCISLITWSDSSVTSSIPDTVAPPVCTDWCLIRNITKHVSIKPQWPYFYSTDNTYNANNVRRRY